MSARRGPLPALWLALCFNTPLVAAGLYRHTADAATHLFFADHYRRSWFALWEPRWFGGFSVSSYPPLVHQLLALLSIPFGSDAAFAILLLSTLIAFPVSVWYFARIFVTPGAAGIAAVIAVFLPGVALAAYAYGQLPTLVALPVALFLVYAFTRFVERGGAAALGLVAALSGVAFAAHHATPLLFLPPALLAALSTSLVGIDHRLRGPRLRRALVGLIAGGVAGAVVIAPFWLWVAGGFHQAFIAHSSRTNFLSDVSAQSLYLWGEYGVLPALALAGLWRRPDRRTVALAALALYLFVVGLGGTTAIPSLLFGQQWQWLTYDRFALWGAAAMLPLAGVAVSGLWASRVGWSRAVAIAALLVLVAYAGANTVWASIGAGPTRDLQPVARFINDGRTQWRYQTFGVGTDESELGYLTSATTIDGSYYSARRLPELTESGVGNLDMALWWEASGRTLSRVLSQANAYSIRWAFVADRSYDPYLAGAGFVHQGSLAGGIEIWENASAPPLPAGALNVPAPDLGGVLWGTLPLAFAIATVGFALASVRTLRPDPTVERQWSAPVSAQPVSALAHD
jgi:hypothetical protein